MSAPGRSAWLLTTLALCSAAATAGNIEASPTSAADAGEATTAGEACAEEGGQCPSAEGDAMEALNVLQRRFERGQATDLQEGSDARGGHAEVMDDDEELIFRELESHSQATATATATARTTSSSTSTHSASGLSSDQMANARFLIQASFGPTRDSLAELNALGSQQEWILRQLQLPVGSHRAYFRQRANPALSDPSNHVVSQWAPCAAGSRWRGYAFGEADLRKSVTVSAGQLLVDGKLVSDLDPAYTGNGLQAPKQCDDGVPRHWQGWRTCASVTRHLSANQCYRNHFPDWVANRYCAQTCFDLGVGWPGDDCSVGWPNLEFSGYLCNVQEYAGVGGWVKLSKSSTCSSNADFVSMLNPGVWLKSPPADLKTDRPFDVLRPGVVILKGDNINCNFGTSLRLISDVEVPGRVYAYEARAHLAKNSLGSPAAATDPHGSLCPSAPRTFLNEESCVVSASCFPSREWLSCGSPNEVESTPAAGHHMPFFLSGVIGSNYGNLDWKFDGPYAHQQHSSYETKGNIWLAKALYGKDQLRQRVAWAISQIVTVAVGNTPQDVFNEMWLQFYDIFVRHSFGNYRTIMREMTFSPIMGNWLTYINNKALDVDGHFPDENYAREVMQIYSIGLWKLHRNGSRMKDAQGGDIRTYDNWNIQEFAKVFTGLVEQDQRGNVEDHVRSKNLIDPMQMNAEWHDASPKADLAGGYLGDGYPLCADLPPQAPFTAGAKFLFMGPVPDGASVSTLEEGSPLFKALCGAASPPCNFSSVVRLPAAVQCSGVECALGPAAAFSVSGNFFEFVPPACVYPFYWPTGQFARYNRADGNRGWWLATRWSKCLAPTGAKAAGPNCCAGCQNEPNHWIKRQGLTCDSVHDRYSWLLPRMCGGSTTDPNGGIRHWATNKFCQKACWQLGHPYGNDNCSAGDFVSDRPCTSDGDMLSYAEAQEKCHSVGMEVCGDRAPPPAGGKCDYVNQRLWTSETCNNSIIVHPDGKVSVGVSTRPADDTFLVHWTGDTFPTVDLSSGGCPSGCEVDGPRCRCAATTETRAVFTELPSAEKVLQRLKVGAFPPSAPCSAGCGGDVEAYQPSGSGGSMSTNTVFGVAGRYYLNVELTVHLPGGHSFRNPPAFLPRGSTDPKPAIDEVESLLDHLFHHDNTPIFVAIRLIQRLTVSNPSPKYVEDVQEAFRSGSYNGTRFSGQYGDLGATVAAILLHPESRKGSDVSGSLREPLLKVVHFMRSMQYVDHGGREVQLARIQEKIGEWPYEAPSVFNFYHPEFQPDGLPVGSVGPEFEIFTMPHVVSFINGMGTMVDYGAPPWRGGFFYNNGAHWGEGGLNYTGKGSKSETIDELDLLLTGGRMGKEGRALVEREYDAAGGLPAAQKASVLTPGFATQGDTSLPTSPLPQPVPAPSPPARDYKATVMLFMQGGADTFQVLVPNKCDLHNEYRTIRESIALTPEQLLEIEAPNQKCKSFGLHPKLRFLQSLYAQEEAAFVSNIGGLLEPLTAQSFINGGRRCSGLFSHIDQERGLQTLTCQTASPVHKGAGGRLADALANGPHKYRVESFSMLGKANWAQGFETVPKIVDHRTGNVPMYDQKIYAALDNVTSIKYGNAFCEEYRRQIKEAVDANKELGSFLDTATLGTNYNAGGSWLSQQLKQVARLIAAKDTRKAERDLFFVQLGGWDHHQGVAEGLDEKLQDVDRSLELFVKELKAQGVFQDTVLVSTSDFGRTLSPNSNAGTDHGWAGHHFILGGQVLGKQIHNEYPRSLLPGYEMDIYHGRLIPEFPWENVFVPIAEWMGLDDSQTSSVFPNLANFNRSKHILSRGQVFSG